MNAEVLQKSPFGFGGLIVADGEDWIDTDMMKGIRIRIDGSNSL